NSAFKNILNGVIEQNKDKSLATMETLKTVTKVSPTAEQIADLLFGEKCVKHLKSNTIVLAKNSQLVGMGCGQTSRIDALNQAIHKAKEFGFELKGTVLISDAFFPFSDCVEIAYKEGIAAILQPGGSVRDKDSIDKCDEYGMPMVFSGLRHFRH
ncbi:MAG: bifunctional phosphoribosylaminoimidazolecarboxamide formyltransferase/IMP cyclohydrolase PurH, partial [Chitinophagales bacterium]